MPHNITSLNDEIVEFSDESIELDITDRKEIQLGWIIAPLKHPMVSIGFQYLIITNTLLILLDKEE